MEKLVTEGNHPSRTILVMTDSPQGPIFEHNWKPIWYLADKIGVYMDEYMHQAERGIGCKSRGSKHQLLIDQSVAKVARSRRNNLGMEWIDYRKSYDSVPHVWILECRRLYKINLRLVTLIRQSMSHWKTTLPANSKSITNVTLKCFIYQRNSLLPLLFCIPLNELSTLLDKNAYGYRFKSGTTINHFL